MAGSAPPRTRDILRVQVHPVAVPGRWRRVRHVVGPVFMALTLALPWVRVGGRPLLRMDIPARTLRVAGAVFSPQDSFLLVLVGLGASFGLFFFTALLGRVWCGFLCPQTVLLEEVVRPLERRLVRPHLAGRRPSLLPVRRALMWGATALVAYVFAATFVAFFAEARDVFLLRAGPSATAFTLGGTAALLFDLGVFRERFCSYLCPYARFQGALTDGDSLVVGYDAARGEPRARGRKRADGAGECVDCGRCVAVCPQGIDIRDGFQLECISCALCVDACAPVMERFGRPSLVRWQAVSGAARPRWLRPRTAAYGAVLALVAVAFAVRLSTRPALDLRVSHMPGTLYQADEDGGVRNTFLAVVTNKGSEPADLRFRVEGLDGAEIIAPQVVVPPGGSRKVPLVVRVPADPGPSTPLRIVVEGAGAEVPAQAAFVGRPPGGEEG